MNLQIQIMLQQAIKAFQGGNLDSADLMLKRVLQVDSKNLPALHILGLVKASQSNYNEAASYLGRAARIHPDDASIQYNLAKALSDSGNDKDALTHHKKAVTLAPNNPEAWLNYGKTASNLGYYNDALAWYDNALSLRPDYAEAALNKGATLKELERYEEALTFADHALTINPNLAEAWSNKGGALKELKRYDEAIASYEKALSLKPDLDWAAGNLLHIKMKICNWSNLTESLRNIYEKVGANKKVINPFSLLALNDNALLHKKSSQIYIQSKYPFNLALGPISNRPQSKKIRVGYFSADFKNHPVAFLIAEVFELHDRNRFEIYGLSYAKAEDEMHQRLQKSFDQFIDVGKKSDAEVAKLSRDLSIEIAVDLTGFTRDGRTGIFAHRAAPVQVSYLGYPGTIGADYIDYIIADKTVIAPKLESCYSEKIICLPNSYQANDRKRLISDRQFTNQELGLPEHGFVFCCFNNNYKILPATFASWMRILKAVEGSILWLFKDNSWAVENLKKEAEKLGIAADRLVFADRMPLSEHLARHRQADLFLDTFPYNAHTSASDALWVGLPVLTLMGESFASRVAASLLNAIAMPELITNSQEQYENLAIELARSSQKLEDIKSRLARNRLTTPLFETPRFTKNLEAAYIKMFERYRANLVPEHITIAQDEF